MKKIISFIVTFILVCIGTMAVFASNEDNSTRTLPRVVDNADLLDSSAEGNLIDKLDEISIRQQMDIVVVTTNSLDGKTPMAYADDFYDENGYGMGNSCDGILLLVSMESRDWWVSTTGFGITAITDAGLDYISEQFLSDLSDGDYEAAFNTYAKLCDEFVTQAKTGNPYDVGNMPKGDFNVPFNILIALGVGLVAALITVMVMWGQMKTVRAKPAAADYIKSGSMVINEKRDRFLYMHTDRKAKPKSSSSGGSSTHRSSSGRRHGGGGGKF